MCVEGEVCGESLLETFGSMTEISFLVIACHKKFF